MTILISDLKSVAGSDAFTVLAKRQIAFERGTEVILSAAKKVREKKGGKRRY